jgi:hypothetical protein
VARGLARGVVTGERRGGDGVGFAVGEQAKGGRRVGKGMVGSVGLSQTEQIRPAAASSQRLCALSPWGCFFLAAPAPGWCGLRAADRGRLAAVSSG